MVEAQAYDLVIVGSGAGAVCAALFAKMRGLSVVVLEKTDRFGGSTAMSGGLIWLPDSGPMRRAGVEDSEEAGFTYMSACADGGPASTPERQLAYLREGHAAIAFLEGQGMEFDYCDGYADYHEGELPGALARGRAIEARMFDMRQLGDKASWIRTAGAGDFSIPISVPEIAAICLNGKTWVSKFAFLKVGFRMMRNRLGKRLVRMGGAMQGRLLRLAIDHDVEIHLGAGVTGLRVEAGRVVGVEALIGGQPVALSARAGVILNAGGFSHNRDMRRRYQGEKTTGEWSSANPGDTGEIIEIAAAAGAALDSMAEAWWIPSTRLPDGTLIFNNPLEMAKPHCIMVDGAGRRYVNEATSYVAIGRAMYARDAAVQALPSWLLLDAQHREKYRWGGQKGVPEAWVRDGYMIRADSITELAGKCGLEPATLNDTVERFNGFARTGVDQDFGRGASAHHRFWGDPTHKPNPSLGTIEKPPFYAVRVQAGDVGTSGGLLTNEHGQVLRNDGSAIEGLYAAGNCTASVMGAAYPGPGASIGASLIFAFAAAKHAYGEASNHAIDPLKGPEIEE